MASQKSHPLNPLSAFSHVLKSLFGLEKGQPESEQVNAVAEVREGLQDIQAGRVREIKSARDLLQDE